MIWALLAAGIVILSLGMAILSEKKKNSEMIYSGIILLLAGLAMTGMALASIINDQDQAKVDKNKSVCVQIPSAQWISDNNTCIKDGRVILP